MNELQAAANHSLTDSGTAIAPDPQPSAPNGLERDAVTGRFLPGNMAAVQHGLRTDRLPAEFASLLADVEEFVQAAIADDGGASEISHRRQSLHGYRARMHRRIAQLDDAIELRGLFDKRGKLRVAWLGQLQALINTAKGIDSLLGLERRQKAVPSIEQYLASRSANGEGGQ